MDEKKNLVSVDGFVQQVILALDKHTARDGMTAQLKMAHVQRKLFPNKELSYRESAVIQLLYPVNNRLHMVLIKRSSRNVQDKHKGQIAFPGGKRDKKDRSLQHTALRELREEVGIQGQRINILGRLTELFIPVSNFMVYPYLAYTDEIPEFKKQDSEVDEIIEMPLGMLFDKKLKRKKNLKVSDQVTLKAVPYYDIFGHIVWGATAMMLSEVEHLLLKDEISVFSRSMKGTWHD